MDAPQGGSAPGVTPPVATAFAVVGFFALLIAGFGMLSLFSGAEVLPVTGLGQAPGIVGAALATIAFTATMWLALRRPHPSYFAAGVAVVVTFLAYLLGIVLGAVVGGVDLARAASAVGGFATSWFAVVLASAALIAGWSGVALVRTRADRPRWPWERD